MTTALPNRIVGTGYAVSTLICLCSALATIRDLMGTSSPPSSSEMPLVGLFVCIGFAGLFGSVAWCLFNQTRKSFVIAAAYISLIALPWGTVLGLLILFWVRPKQTFDIKPPSSKSAPEPWAKVIHTAFAAYLIAHLLPAYRLGGDLVFGYTATWLSFIGTILLADHKPDENFNGLACLFGLLANVLLVCAMAGYVFFALRNDLKRPKSPYRVAAALTTIAGACTLIATFFLGTHGTSHFVPLIGHFVWIASMWTICVTCLVSGSTGNTNPIVRGGPDR